MTRHRKLVICLIAMLSAEVAFSQAASTEGNGGVLVGPSSSPVAYVYVSSSPSSNKNEINAYNAAANGKLAPVKGSPFSAATGYDGSMAVNGKHLFLTNGVSIYSYSIAADGALRRVAATNAQRFNQSDCGGPAYLFLDRTGATLYDMDIYSDCANNAYQFFGVDGSTGGLNYLGVTAASTPEFEVSLSFTGNNQYAYGASCYHWYQDIFGFVRNSDGSLTALTINPAMPAAQNGDIYCPFLAAADSANHVAVPVEALNNSSLQPSGAYQLAVYSADSSGNLSTTSTYRNMPKVAVASVTSVSVSPSGKLLAVGGSGGLQVFHFNGSRPITHFTGLLTKDEVDQVAWDHDNHLYAISRSAGKLFVFTITSTGYSQAAGSPYAITSPQSVSVLPR
jgi:WD40 repeat protein